MALTETKSPVPRKLDDGMITALSLAIAKGNYAVTACQLCGVSHKTLWEWLKQAELDDLQDITAEDSIYVRLAEALKKAEADAEAELVSVIRESATVKREWIPAITFLERRHPDRWGRKERHQVDINETKVVQITTITEIRNQGQIVEGEYKELGSVQGQGVTEEDNKR